MKKYEEHLEKGIIFNIKKRIRYIIFSIIYLFTTKRKFNILDNEKTIMKIVNEGYSLCRYGDGEFQWIMGESFNSFQDNSLQLGEALKNIFSDYNPEYKILIGINGTLNSLSGLTYDAKLYWKRFIIKFGKKVYGFLPDIEYCDSNITRPYMDYADKSEEVMQNKFDNIKKIWNDRDIIIVEGEFTKLGVDNDLFDNCKSIKRIICPAKNAYFKYDKIFEKIIEVATNSNLILISLGPTATVLAYNLAKKGYQSIDTGHIDVEYMWFKNNYKTKEAIAGKYVNEAENKMSETNSENKDYENQIIAKIL